MRCEKEAAVLKLTSQYKYQLNNGTHLFLRNGNGSLNKILMEDSIEVYAGNTPVYGSFMASTVAG